MKDYHINIFYSEEDEGYIADIPDLSFCYAFVLYFNHLILFTTQIFLVGFSDKLY